MSNSLVKAIESISSFDSLKARFSTWLFSIARNEALAFLRRPRLLTSSLSDSQDYTTEEESDNPRLDALQEAMALLSADERTLLHLHYYEDMPLAEIAVITEIREGTLAVRLHRLRMKLKKMMEHE